MEQHFKTAGYVRLSRDDETIGESVSIGTQKEIIKRFCETNNLYLKEFYTDDGWSGTNFNRPDFQRMLNDIESGEINCIVTKDLSRLGRDYIMTGYYTEVFFPENNIRYIAIGDGFDTQNENSSNNDIAPFKNLLNDFHARETSKKVRNAKYTKALNGDNSATYAPIGYKKDPENKGHLIIDEETAWIVRKIFEMYCSGKGCFIIRNYLEENKIYTPSALIYSRGSTKYDYMNFATDEKMRYRWNRDMVRRILKNETYIGHSVHYRNRKATYKSKNKRQPKEKQLIIKNTHEPIIDMETWNMVQKRMVSHVDDTRKFENIFAGIAQCADCGKSMSFSTHYYNGKQVQRTYRTLVCRTYTSYGKNYCTCHNTNYDNLKQIVQEAINQVINMVNIDEQKLLDKIHDSIGKNKNSNLSTMKMRIEKIEKRLKEIDTIFLKLYEDMALSIITKPNYEMINNKLQEEKSNLSEELKPLKKQICDNDCKESNAKNFIELLKKAKHIDILDSETINQFIEKIAIHNVKKSATGKKGNTQQIDIYYKFIGNINFF